MVGIVIVSHSAELASGLHVLATQMSQNKVQIVTAAGIDDPEDPIGTDVTKILDAILQVYSDDGVVVFMDMGSAVLNTEIAYKGLNDEQRKKVHLSDAPLAEGVITATITASTGGTLHDILHDLTGALNAKRSLLSSASQETPLPSATKEQRTNNTNKPNLQAESNPKASISPPHILKGIRVTGGVEMAPAFIFTKTLQDVTKDEINDPDAEITKLSDVINAAASDLNKLIAKASDSISAEEANIFKAHKLIICDPELTKEVNQQIRTEKVSAAYAWRKVIATYIQMYKQAPGTIMGDRAADVQDAGQRVLSILTGVPISRPKPSEPVVLITDELSPSDTANLDPELILGLICEGGSETSHSGILVRALGIPAVFCVEGILSAAENGRPCILDADNAVVYLSPDQDQINIFSQRREKWLKTRRLADARKFERVYTSENEPIEVLANVSEPKHVEQALEDGAEGIGLYRTEFLYMNRSEAPSEQEQYEVYMKAIESMKGLPVTFRTIDVGGDKPVRYLSIEKEANPFLGWRGIRFSLDKTSIFKTQLRALLRASVHGPLKIMFPMISVLEEWKKARQLFDQAKEELKNDGIAFSDTIHLGMMVEVPSAAIRIRDFLGEVDFVSIGTNDLVQYIMAADRMNTRVAALASYHEPAVTDMIALVIKACNECGVHVSICGEMARDTQVTDMLLALGLRSFSMSASEIPEFKLHLLPYDSQP